MKRTVILFLSTLALALATHAAGDDALTTPWACGFTAGAGALLPTGHLKDNFKGTAVFTAGLTGNYHQWRLNVAMHYGQPSFKRDNIYDVRDEAGRNAQLNSAASASQLGLALQLGYTVPCNNRVSITPLAGVYWSRYGWRVNDIIWSKNDEGNDVFQVTDTHSTSLSNVNWMAAVDIDIVLHRHITQEPFFLGGKRAQLSSSLRITPFVSHARYSHSNPSVSGNFVGITVAYLGLARGLNY